MNVTPTSPQKHISELVRNKTRTYHQKSPRFHRRRYCSKKLFQSVVDWLDQIPIRRNLKRTFDGDWFAAGRIEADPEYYETEETMSRRTPGRPSASIEPSSILGSEAGQSRPPTANNTTKYTDPLVKRRHYRVDHLRPNNIILRSHDDPIPDYVERVCEMIKEDTQPPEQSTSPGQAIMRELISLQNLPVSEGEVSYFFQRLMFPGDDFRIMDKLELQRSIDTFFLKHIVPGSDVHPTQRVSIPKPDLAYGYTTDIDGEAFTEAQRLAGKEMTPMLGIANNSGLAFPFLVVELKSIDDIWIATNQCLGGSATCVNIIECLNARLREYSNACTVDSTTFSVAANRIEAFLYVSWIAEDLTYYTKEVDSFWLRDPEHVRRLKNVAQNIIDWGKGDRLQQIREGLDFILEQDIGAKSELAKARSTEKEGSSRVKRSRTAHKS